MKITLELGSARGRVWRADLSRAESLGSNSSALRREREADTKGREGKKRTRPCPGCWLGSHRSDGGVIFR